MNKTIEAEVKIKSLLEIIESQKQTFDALLKKYNDIAGANRSTPINTEGLRDKYDDLYISHFVDAEYLVASREAKALIRRGMMEMRELLKPHLRNDTEGQNNKGVDAVGFAEWLGEKGYTKHKIGEQNHDGTNMWYDPEYDYTEVGRTSELLSLYIEELNKKA